MLLPLFYMKESLNRIKQLLDTRHDSECEDWMYQYESVLSSIEEEVNKHENKFKRDVEAA